MVEPGVLIPVCINAVLCAVVLWLWAKVRALRSVNAALQEKCRGATEQSFHLRLKLQDYLRGSETKVGLPTTDVTGRSKLLSPQIVTDRIDNSTNRSGRQ